MKFNKSGHLLLLSVASLLAASLVTACSTLTVDFVYITSALAAGSNQWGQVDVFEVNSESGRMRQIKNSPFPSGGRNPVGDAVSADNTTLYVVNKDDNSIVQFTIGSDGKLYPQNTVNTPGIYPLAIAVGGSHLYSVATYQPLATCSNASPCSGAVSVFPINSDHSLASAVSNTSISTNYWPLTLPGAANDVIKPTAIALASSGTYVYITAVDTTAGGGYVFGFSTNSDGSLSALNGGVPFPAGTLPSAVASDPSGAHLYVTDSANSSVLGFQINSGILTQLSGSPYRSGGSPTAIVVDATGKFAYVANGQDSTVSAYSISNGNLTSVGSYSTGTQPVAIGIDPSLNEYLYTANFLGNNINGFQVNATDGTLLNSQFSPYTSNAEPTAVAAIPHGSQKK